jgi:hypothetical protein
MFSVGVPPPSDSHQLSQEHDATVGESKSSEQQQQQQQQQ